MGRGGRKKMRDEPMRKCVVSGEVVSKAHLIRFVVAPSGEIVPDLAEKLPGRGIWVTADGDTLRRAVAKKHFARAARQAVTVPTDLVGVVSAGLERRLTDGIALARKAGQAVAGYERVKGWLETGEAVVLLQASDGSERGKTKLSAPGGVATHIQALNAQQLGLAFGRERVIHGALAAGGLAKRVVEDAAKLSGVRKETGVSAPMEGTKTT